MSLLLIAVATAIMTVQDINPPLLVNERTAPACHSVGLQKWWSLHILEGLFFKLCTVSRGGKGIIFFFLSFQKIMNSTQRGEREKREERKERERERERERFDT